MLTVTASSPSKSEEYENFSQAVKSLAKSKFNYTYEGSVNNFVANFHDAVRPFFINNGRMYTFSVNSGNSEHRSV